MSAFFIGDERRYRLLKTDFKTLLKQLHETRRTRSFSSSIYIPSTGRRYEASLCCFNTLKKIT